MSAGEHAWPFVSRRSFLASAAALALAACAPNTRPLSPSARATPTSTGTPAATSPDAATPTAATPAVTPTATAATTPAPSAGRVLYRDAALADARSPSLAVGVSLMVEGGRISWIRPTDAEEDPGPADGLDVIDASGSTIVPGMVDSHSHLTLPGGAHWLERGLDPPARLLEYAEHNARLMRGAGIFWARDVGAPTVDDPVDGRRRALSLGVRDR